MAEIGNTSVFSQTDASNNTSTDPGWPEGMAPSRVNDAARALQGAITRDWNWKGPTVTSGGSANAYTLTYSVAPAAYYTGQIFAFKANFTNTGATTINVNTLGAKNVFVNNAACVGGEIISGNWYVVGYDGTQFQMLSPIASQHGALIGLQKFSAAGTSTYTPTAGANTYVAEVVGGGGGGGGCASTGAGQVAVASGGGGGGYALKRGLISAISGATVTVGAGGTGGTAGANNGTAGGTSSIGAVVTASGGGLGPGAAAASPPVSLNCNSGGIGSSGDVNIRGYQAVAQINASSALVIPIRGGGSRFSEGSEATATATGAAGNNGTGFGGGGGGAANAASQGAGLAGGNGSDGLVLIWEYN